LGERAVASGGGGGRLVVVDLLVFIRMLIFLTADFGCVTKKSCAPKIEQEGMSINLEEPIRLPSPNRINFSVCLSVRPLYENT
jgi:hypothetical protein